MSSFGIAWQTKGMALPGLHLQDKVPRNSASLLGLGHHMSSLYVKDLMIPNDLLVLLKTGKFGTCNSPCSDLQVLNLG